MFRSTKRENARLRLRIDALVHQVETEKRLRETAIGNQARMARHFSSQHDELTRLRSSDGRLRRALRACAGYRSDLAAQHRVTDRLSDQLMDAMGYTDTALIRLSVDLTNADREVTP